MRTGNSSRRPTQSSMGFTAILAIALLAPLAVHEAHAASTAPIQGYRVVRTFPHDGAFTEGLIYEDGALYESTGLNALSTLRKVEIETGRVLQLYKLPNRYFAEGLTSWQGKLIQLTWHSRTIFVYDQTTLALLRQVLYRGEAWGLTHDGARLILSNGSSSLHFLDPDSFAELGQIEVTDQGEPVDDLNELEYVGGLVFANVFKTSRIAIIDPATGQVVAWLDLGGIFGPLEGRAAGLPTLANGIAYDAAGNCLFVTGKYWPSVFQIELVP